MTSSDQKISLLKLSTECNELGIELMGVTEIVSESGELAPWFAPHVHKLQEWIATGANAEMIWMEEQMDKRCDPRLLLPDVRSAVSLWVGHHFLEPTKKTQSIASDSPCVATELTANKVAKVARYAWGRDYHNVLRRVLRRLSKWLKAQSSEITSHGSVDTSPVLERAIAERCGVGWIGKSTLLVHPKRGTFGSIAVLLTSATFDELNEKHPHRCGSCNDCIQICPTGAIGPQGLDARRCISYWTIEHRGLIPKEMRPKIDDWVFGCDLCQEVCPWTIKAGRTMPPPPDSLWHPQEERARPDLIQWLLTPDEELNDILKGSPLRRAFPHGLKRNALIVLANLKEVKAIPIAIDLLDHKEMSVRGSAAWCLSELGSLSILEESTHIQIIEHLAARLLKEEHRAVRTELQNAINHLCSSAG